MLFLLLAVVATADVFFYSDDYCHTVLGQTKFGDTTAVINYTTPVTVLIYNNPQSAQFKLQTQPTGSTGITTYLSLTPTAIPCDISTDDGRFVKVQFSNNILNLWTQEQRLWTVNVKDLPAASGGYKFVSNITYPYQFTKLLGCQYYYGFSLTSTCYQPLFGIADGTKGGCSAYNGSFSSTLWQSINYY